jgi:chemotaxis protein MotA
VLARTWTGILSVGVLGSVVLQVALPSTGWVAATAGFVLVVGGTALVARLSHSQDSLLALKAGVRDALTRRSAAAVEANEARLEGFLQAANLFRRGNIRPAEAAAELIESPVLRRGTQLVLDGFQQRQVAVALQRQIAEERERLLGPVELLRAMAGYSPTLGMLGTLLGLLQMLFGVGSGDMNRMGAAMGFAMLTTVYGLVIANLVFKPLATKLEQRNRARLAENLVDFQAVMLLYERQHPEYIREVVNDTRPERARHPVPSTASYAGSY